MPSQRWEVLGGADKGGILVRSGRELNSPEAAVRLSTRALIEQIDLRGERLRYKLLEGTGPSEGWVSISLKGKSLVARTNRALSATAESDEALGWLRPGAANGRKILFLTMPWKGHIVHLRRLAQWFDAGCRGGCHLHAAVFPESTGAMPAGVVCYTMRDDESSSAAFMAELEDAFRRLALEATDYNSGVGGFYTAIMQAVAKHTARGEDPLAAIFSFYFRVVQEVKPDIIVGDKFANQSSLMQGYCAAEGIPFIMVNSPGLPETWSGSPDGAKAATLPAEDVEVTARALGLSKELVEAFSSGGAMSPELLLLAPKPAEMTLLALLMSLGNPMAAPFMAAPIAKKLGMKPTQVGKLIRAIGTSESPLCLHPSSRALLGEDLAQRPDDLFTGPFLPLPGPVEAGGASVQGSAAGLEAALAAADSALLEWLFAGDEATPIVYMAFGSIVRPDGELVAKLVEALDNGPWRVLWALPQELHGLLPAGLGGERWRVESFVPQADVLKCDRVRCFVSHNGANSTVESLACGVPMVCMPFYMDQYDWAKVVCDRREAGIQVEKFGPPGELRQAVCQVLQETRYRQGALAASRIMRAQEGAVLARLGPAMTPPSEAVGSGVSVAAAAVLALLQGQDLALIFQIIENSTAEAIAKENSL